MEIILDRSKPFRYKVLTNSNGVGTKLLVVLVSSLVAMVYGSIVIVSSLRKIIVLVRIQVDFKSLAIVAIGVSPVNFKVGFVDNHTLSSLVCGMVILSSSGVSDDVGVIAFDSSGMTPGIEVIKVVFFNDRLEVSLVAIRHGLVVDNLMLVLDLEISLVQVNLISFGIVRVSQASNSVSVSLGNSFSVNLSQTSVLSVCLTVLNLEPWLLVGVENF